MRHSADGLKRGPFDGGYVTRDGYVRYDRVKREYVSLAPQWILPTIVDLTGAMRDQN